MIGLTLSDWFRLKAQSTPAPVPAPKAKSVIQLWMAGGPTQTDTWDPKPNAGEDFTGPLRRTLPTWSFFVLSALEDFERSFGARATKNRKLYNGNIRCWFYQYFGPLPR